MTMRRMLLGLVGAVATCGAATAVPPGALSEGRETDPVARDFYLAAPGAAPESAAPARAERPGDTVGGSILGAVAAALINRMTFPLGTVPTDGSR